MYHVILRWFWFICKNTRILKQSFQKMASRKVFVAIIIAVGFAFVIISYNCGFDLCRTAPVEKRPHFSISTIPKNDFDAYKQGMLPANTFASGDLNRSYNLEFEKEDVMVFLHMQKTGGTTFGRHLVKNLENESPCKCFKGKKRCDCYTSKRTIWLFSRYSTGWLCGLHADWTELNSCVEDALNKKEKTTRSRRYHYITFLRDPVKRFLSEWKHTQRGATWKAARLFCNGRGPTLDELRPCYNMNYTWEGVKLDEFLDCDSNLARNRQTRMLANLTKINCYNSTGWKPEIRNQLMLQSAKDNLLNMDYFGLTEFQKYSQQLFEYGFNMNFKTPWSQLPKTHSDKAKISETQKTKILEQNRLDIELYQYAKDLFLQRVMRMKKDKGDESEIETFEYDDDEKFDVNMDIDDADEREMEEEDDY